jgi:hypothetical protein
MSFLDGFGSLQLHRGNVRYKSGVEQFAGRHCVLATAGAACTGEVGWFMQLQANSCTCHWITQSHSPLLTCADSFRSFLSAHHTGRWLHSPSYVCSGTAWCDRHSSCLCTVQPVQQQAGTAGACRLQRLQQAGGSSSAAQVADTQGAAQCGAAAAEACKGCGQLQG